jgi:hypothetical protein
VAPQQQLEEALALATPFAGSPEFDKRIEWLNHRLAELST